MACFCLTGKLSEPPAINYRMRFSPLPVPEITIRAFLVTRKGLLRFRLISVNLPPACAFAVQRPLLYEAFHIFRGIAQKQSDLMGKFRRGPELFHQPDDAAVRIPAGIPPLFQESAGKRIAQALFQHIRAEKIQKRPVVFET